MQNYQRKIEAAHFLTNCCYFALETFRIQVTLALRSHERPVVESGARPPETAVKRWRHLTSEKRMTKRRPLWMSRSLGRQTQKVSLTSLEKSSIILSLCLICSECAAASWHPHYTVNPDYLDFRGRCWYSTCALLLLLVSLLLLLLLLL